MRQRHDTRIAGWSAARLPAGRKRGPRRLEGRVIDRAGAGGSLLVPDRCLCAWSDGSCRSRHTNSDHGTGRCRCRVDRGTVVLGDQLRYSGQSDSSITRTKSPRTKPGTKWASTSALTLPKVVAGRLPGHCGEPDHHVRGGARLEHRGLGVGTHIMGHLEPAEGTTAPGVRPALRNAFAVEPRHLLDQIVIVQEDVGREGHGRDLPGIACTASSCLHSGPRAHVRRRHQRPCAIPPVVIRRHLLAAIGSGTNRRSPRGGGAGSAGLVVPIEQSGG